MFWAGHNYESYESRMRNDLADLFDDYAGIRQAILSERHGLVAASHLVNRVRDTHCEGLREHGLEAEMYSILGRLKESSFVSHKTCLRPKVEEYDSPTYLVVGTSCAPDDPEGRIVGALDLIARTSFATIVKRVNSMALITLGEGTFPNTNQSYTIKNIFMTVYLDHYESDVLLAESIVHEHAHMTFNNYVYRNKSYEDPNPRFYSPWKECMRPTFNFVHSIIAFSDVIRFLEEVSFFDLSEIDRKYVDMKLSFERRNLSSVQESTAQALSSLPDQEIADRIATAIDAVQ